MTPNPSLLAMAEDQDTTMTKKIKKTKSAHEASAAPLAALGLPGFTSLEVETLTAAYKVSDEAYHILLSNMLTDSQYVLVTGFTKSGIGVAGGPFAGKTLAFDSNGKMTVLPSALGASL